MKFQGTPEITSRARLPMLLTYKARPDVPKPTLVAPSLPLTNVYWALTLYQAVWFGGKCTRFGARRPGYEHCFCQLLIMRCWANNSASFSLTLHVCSRWCKVQMKRNACLSTVPGAQETPSRRCLPSLLNARELRNEHLRNAHVLYTEVAYSCSHITRDKAKSQGLRKVRQLTCHLMAGGGQGWTQICLALTRCFPHSETLLPNPGLTYHMVWCVSTWGCVRHSWQRPRVGVE